MSREVEEIKARLDLVDIVQEYLPLKRAGSNWKANCPFHQEKSPSFMVSQPKQIWHCFGCHKGGDLFTFVQEMEGADFYETLKLLAQKAGVTLQKRSPKEQNKKQRLMDLVDLSSKFFHKVLLDHPKAQHARDYLNKRGVEQKTIASFQLGYAPDSWDTLLKFLQQRGFSQAEIVEAGMAVHNTDRNSIYDRFRDRLMIPLTDIYDNTVGFTARALAENFEGGKYINTPQSEIYDKSSVVFGLAKAKQAVKEAGYAVLVEGNMDVISSHQAGVLPVVAVSGTALTQKQLGLIKRFAKNCYFCFDADEAGFAAAKKGIQLALASGFEVSIVRLPSGKDPDECIRKDVDLWKSAIANAEPAIDSLLRHGLDRYDVTSPEGKKAFSKEVVDLIAQVQNAVERDHYLQQLANALDVSLPSVRELYGGLKEKPALPPQPVQTAKPDDASSPADQSLQDCVALLLSRPMLFKLTRDEVFADTKYETLYKQAKNYYDSATDLTEPHPKLSESLSTDSQTVLTHLLLYADQAFAGLDASASREAFEARMTFLRRQRLQKLLRQLQASLQAAEELGDEQAITELSGRFARLSEELTSLQ